MRYPWSNYSSKIKAFKFLLNILDENEGKHKQWKSFFEHSLW